MMISIGDCYTNNDIDTYWDILWYDICGDKRADMFQLVS